MSESFVRNRPAFGVCLDRGIGRTLGKRVGVEGRGSLLGLMLVRKSATEALVFRDKLDMAEEMSRATRGIGSLLVVSTGLGAARAFTFDSFRGRKGRCPMPPISSGCLHSIVPQVTRSISFEADEESQSVSVCLLRTSRGPEKLQPSAMYQKKHVTKLDNNNLQRLSARLDCIFTV